MFSKPHFSFAGLLTLACFSFLPAVAQDTLHADGLLQEARKAAFDRKDYPGAKHFLYKALFLSPGYSDCRIFLGRIFSWTADADSARICFQEVLAGDPEYEDASLAFTDLEYWNNQYPAALEICRNGLRYHPDSEELHLREAKIWIALRRFRAADSVVRQLLRINKNSKAAASLAGTIKELSFRNKINASYDFAWFDRQFKNPWHLGTIDYGRVTKWGTVTGRINYANRFNSNGLQLEAEAYPRISRTFYSYVETAWSGTDGIFPRWRAGYSLYANLPHGFEGELGFRYLQFSGTPTWIYTASMGKYYKSWLLTARVYLTPGAYTAAASVSYSFLVRYYFGGADDFIGASAGYGISPDDRYNAIQLDNKTRLTSYSSGLQYKQKFFHREVLSVSLGWLNQEYLPGIKGNQFQSGIAWQHRF
jgi:YaiO family outer membrane protein